MMFLIVTTKYSGRDSYKVLVYRTEGRAPTAEMQLTLDAFPHEPTIGERFELVIG